MSLPSTDGHTFPCLPLALLGPKNVGCRCVLECTIEYPRRARDCTLLNTGIKRSLGSRGTLSSLNAVSSSAYNSEDPSVPSTALTALPVAGGQIVPCLNIGVACSFIERRTGAWRITAWTSPVLGMRSTRSPPSCRRGKRGRTMTASTITR